MNKKRKNNHRPFWRDRKRRRQKEDEDLLFEKGLLFHTTFSFTPPPLQKVQLIKCCSIFFMVTKQMDIYKINDMYNGIVIDNICFFKCEHLFF